MSNRANLCFAKIHLLHILHASSRRERCFARSLGRCYGLGWGQVLLCRNEYVLRRVDAYSQGENTILHSTQAYDTLRYLEHMRPFDDIALWVVERFTVLHHKVHIRLKIVQRFVLTFLDFFLQKQNKRNRNTNKHQRRMTRLWCDSDENISLPSCRPWRLVAQ